MGRYRNIVASALAGVILTAILSMALIVPASACCPDEPGTWCNSVISQEEVAASRAKTGVVEYVGVNVVGGIIALVALKIAGKKKSEE